MTVGLAKVAVACWAQRVDGWQRMEIPTVEGRTHAEDIVAEVAPYSEVWNLDCGGRDKELRLTLKGPRASPALRNELRSRVMWYCINVGRSSGAVHQQRESLFKYHVALALGMM